MEQQHSSSERNCWYATLHGYPIRVEEHLNNLSYIVEFYDGRDDTSAQCISHCPETGELLTVELLRENILG